MVRLKAVFAQRPRPRPRSRFVVIASVLYTLKNRYRYEDDIRQRVRSQRRGGK